MSDKNISNFPDYGPYHDYPNEPIGGGNPYWKCSSCGASDPHVNGTLSKHFSGCSWVKKKKLELSNNYSI